MTSIDTSIYNRPQQDPMQGISNALTVANGVQQNRILGLDANILSKQFEGNQAVGQAYQGAVRPDGTIDTGILGNALSRNPAAAYVAPQAYQGAANLQGTNIANTNNAATGNQNQVSDALGAMNSIAAAGGTRQAILQEALTRVHNGTLSPQGYHVIADNMPPDDKGAQTYIRTKTAGMIAPSTQAQPAPVGMGPNLVPQIGTGADQAAKARQPNGLVLQAPPGAVDAESAVGKQSGEQLAADRANNANFTQQIFPLRKAISSLESLGTTGTGPGTEQRNSIVSFLQSLGVPGISSDNVKNFDEANKYLTDWVNQNGNTSTNDKLAAAFAGNPSVHISNAAAVDVAKSALSLRRMQQAKEAAFTATGLPASQYTNWASKWTTQQDPRAYGFDLMSPEARSKLQQSLGGPKSPEYSKFVSSYQYAKSLLDAPSSAAHPGQGQ